jgi:hypothetical protein
MSLKSKIEYTMNLEDVAVRIQWLAEAGLRIAVDNADALCDHGISGLQTILEQIHDLASPLSDKIEVMERESAA